MRRTETTMRLISTQLITYTKQQAAFIFYYKVIKFKQKSIIFEDLPQNLVPASKLGMRTVWVNYQKVQNLSNNYALSINFTTKNLTKWVQRLTKEI